MAKMNSAGERSFDAALKTTLRSAASSAIVAAGTVAEAAVSLETLTAYWNSGELPNGEFEVIVFVNSAVFATNESYTFLVETASTSGFASPTVVASLPNIAQSGKNGMYVLPIHGPTLKKIDPTASFIRVKAVVAGTAPNLDYYAWML
jgi:hypothetical protein